MDSPDKIVELLLGAIQKQCLPGIWSKGMDLARIGAVLQESAKTDELIFRVRIKDRPVANKVSLWPADEDWFCDCNDRNDVCPHVAAAVISLKNGMLSQSTAPQIHYRFARSDGGLRLERVIVQGAKETFLRDSLTSYIGGIQSGRVQAPVVPATQEDFVIDSIVSQDLHQTKLIAALSESPHVFLDGVKVTTVGKPLSIRAVLIPEGNGYRIHGIEDAAITERFKNEVVLCGTVLRIQSELPWNPEQREMLTSAGKYFSPTDVIRLTSDVIPALEKRVQFENRAPGLPQVVELMPRMVLNLEGTADTLLSVVPSLVYGNPPIAFVQDGVIQNLQSRQIPLRDIAAEKILIRKLQMELHLSPGQSSHFQGAAAVDWLSKLQDWETSGTGVQSFSTTLKPLNAEIDYTEKNGIRLVFKNAVTGADPDAVFKAWKKNETHVQLFDGAWAPLPKDWLDRYGKQITSLMDAQTKDPNRKLPAFLLPDLADLLQSSAQALPVFLTKLQDLLTHFEKIEDYPLPKDLRAELRGYQKKGVNWLSFLRDAKMGALLADDMGLGKTLQALCAVRGRTLIVTPTSVIQNWEDQISQFRPSLTCNTYYGAHRILDSQSDITLTTYGLLRVDREALSSERWDTIILDEAQTIKNPDSQIAKAAHALQGDFRIALSGTPIENRLDDLWSQFQFLNPGLLGSREDFLNQYSGLGATRLLRNRIKPFILRRLKKEVAPELPPRTETVLQCELSPKEQDVYDSILSATKAEVVEKLAQGGSVFAALEILLRLRQASCHVALVPGQAAESSSKIELLLCTLENSIELGHRALVFSQWTSFLDLIEPHFKAAGITYLRLDGSTKDRGELVRQFQAEGGPSVLLISLKAGGVGLTLTAADHIFLLDPWWNPAVEDQAADRAHRIGQTNPVLIHRLVAKGTIEDRILTLQKGKKELADAILTGGGSSLSLSRDDILNLLS